MCSHNFLITSIGSFSAESAVDSIKEHFEGSLYGCDIYPAEWHHISKKFNKVFLAPPVKNEAEYLNFVTATCREYSIEIIIPLTDVEVDFFTKNREYFLEKNILVTVANEKFIAIARDKKRLSDYLTRNQFDSISTYATDELSRVAFPLIGKPVDGRSSEGIFYLNSEDDLKPNVDYSGYIFQDVIKGDICSVDYVRNSMTKSSYSIPRIELLRTKTGAGMTIKTIKSERIVEIVEKIGEDLNINGCVNMEFIITNSHNYLIDINPRFSAGIGFSKIAGYDFVKNHVFAFTGKDIEPCAAYKIIIAQKRMSEVINQYISLSN